MKIIIDSDALFALYVASDAHHQEAKRTFERLFKDENELFATNLVFQETATVISHRFGQKQANDFVARFSQAGIKPLFVGQELTVKSWEIFKKQGKKGTSFVDCANMVVYKEIKAEEIMSFDKFYRKTGLNVSS